MLPKGIKFAYVIAMIAAAALSFVILRNLDEATTVGHSQVLSVHRMSDRTNHARFADVVKAFSRDRQVNVARLAYDPLNNSIRRIYLAVGDPQAPSTRWLQEGYPYFSRDARVEVHPYDEVGASDPEGLYFVYGSQHLTFELGQEFRALGFTVFTEPKFSVLNAIQSSGDRATAWLLLVVALIVVVAVASSITLNAKSYGVQRLQGQSFIAILLRDLRQLVPFAGIAAAVTVFAVTTSLSIYNGLHQFGSYARIAASVLALYVFAAIVAHLVTLALVHRAPLVDAVKGEVTTTWALIASYVLRCWSMLLLFTIGTSAIAGAIDLQKERAALQTWTAAGEAYYLRISGAVMNPDGGDLAQDRIGKWISEADERNEISIASRQVVLGVASEVIVVNNRYLDLHAVYDSSGARVQAQPGDTIRVLLPNRHSDLSTQVAAGISRWAKSVSAGPRRNAPARVGVIQIRNDQSHVFYSAPVDSDIPLLKEATIVVVPSSSGFISDADYMAMASRKEILFEEPTRALASLAAAGVGDYILGMSPFAVDAGQGYRDAKRNFAVHVLNTIAGIAVLLATALAVSYVYIGRNSQTIFVKYINGWTFLRIHWAILVIECVIGLTLFLWVWRNTAVVLERQQIPGAAPVVLDAVFLGGWQPAVAGGVTLFSLLIIVASLMRATTNFARSKSASLY